jgi:hypothetical protein
MKELPAWIAEIELCRTHSKLNEIRACIYKAHLDKRLTEDEANQAIVRIRARRKEIDIADKAPFFVHYPADKWVTSTVK